MPPFNPINTQHSARRLKRGVVAWPANRMVAISIYLSLSLSLYIYIYIYMKIKVCLYTAIAALGALVTCHKNMLLKPCAYGRIANETPTRV